MITASHNPKLDAGYKVYWKDGCQIRPPMDEGIQSCILQNCQPWMDYGALLTSLQRKHVDVCCGLSDAHVTRDVTRDYFHAIATSGLVTGQAQSLLSTRDANFNPPKFAYTAMHGVGREVAVKVFQVFGLPAFHSVPSQELPDEEFPTVPFPNPEEVGALDLAMEFAVQHDCSIVLANDPDADRLAVAERNATTGEWTVFKGDEIGTMLGYWLWQQVGTKCDKVRVLLYLSVFEYVCVSMCRFLPSFILTIYHLINYGVARGNVCIDGIFQHAGGNCKRVWISFRRNVDWL